MANFLNLSNDGLRLNWQVGLETDIGGGRENQDDCFVWIKRDDNLIVLCVLDGHGREVGKIASESAKVCLFKYLDENYNRLLQAPEEFLINAHNVAHENIRESFRSELVRLGNEVVTTDGGFLMKRKHSADGWSCVHGGTSCSLAAVVGDQLYIANVGDSTGILCSSFNILKASGVSYVRDAAVPRELDRQRCRAGASSASEEEVSTGRAMPVQTDAIPQVDGGSNSASIHARPDKQSSGEIAADSAVVQGPPEGSNCAALVVTAEHSPECPYEYARLLRFREREGNPLLPALVVVYDSSTSDKTRCAPVFERDPAGVPVVTNKGSYYKNVRREWASLVSTPPYAQFQDALAFTRSLGDLHLHTYGVTHLPEVQRVNLRAVFDDLDRHCATLPALVPNEPIPSAREGDAQEQEAPSSSGAGAAVVPPSATRQPLSAEEVSRSTVCLVLATDGVWDNWAYEDVCRFVMDASCLNAVGMGPEGAKRVTISFMQRNALYAKRNFGSSADNATGIVLYLSKDPRFPAL